MHMAEMTRARELALYHMDPSRTISLDVYKRQGMVNPARCKTNRGRVACPPDPRVLVAPVP